MDAQAAQVRYLTQRIGQTPQTRCSQRKRITARENDFLDRLVLSDEGQRFGKPGALTVRLLVRILAAEAVAAMYGAGGGAQQ